MKTFPAIDDCRTLRLGKVNRPQGNLTSVQGGQDIPFEIKRVYYLYDIPGGADRGGHAHYDLEQLLVAPMGSFDVLLDDGSTRRTVHLNSASSGLYIPRMIWRELINFSSGAICLVLASNPYTESDYIRQHSEFLSLRKQA